MIQSTIFTFCILLFDLIVTALDCGNYNKITLDFLCCRLNLMLHLDICHIDSGSSLWILSSISCYRILYLLLIVVCLIHSGLEFIDKVVELLNREVLDVDANTWFLLVQEGCKLCGIISFVNDLDPEILLLTLIGVGILRIIFLLLLLVVH